MRYVEINYIMIMVDDFTVCIQDDVNDDTITSSIDCDTGEDIQEFFTIITDFIDSDAVSSDVGDFTITLIAENDYKIYSAIEDDYILIDGESLKELCVAIINA
jgi:hypothetical protein